VYDLNKTEMSDMLSSDVLSAVHLLPTTFNYLKNSKTFNHHSKTVMKISKYHTKQVYIQAGSILLLTLQMSSGT